MVELLTTKCCQEIRFDFLGIVDPFDGESFPLLDNAEQEPASRGVGKGTD